MSAEATTEDTTTEATSRFPSVNWAALGRGTREFIVHAVGQPRVLKISYPGLMHALIFWGMTIQIIGTAIAIMQMKLFTPFELTTPRSGAYLYFELVMDLAGVAIIVGVIMAAVRRWGIKPKSLETKWDDVYVLGLLLVIAVFGFLTEGLRIVATSPDWANWSPVGNLTANVFDGLGMTSEQAWNSHEFLYWGHLILGLVFVASIPFTKLRHLIYGPANIVLRPRRKDNTLPVIEDIEETEVLGVSQPTEFLPQQLLSWDACVRCGRCDRVCPAASSGLSLMPRMLVQSLRDSAVATLIQPNGNDKKPVELETTSAGEMSWLCTTCGACAMECPLFISPVSGIVDLRRSMALMTGSVPNSIGAVLRNFEVQGNPWGLPATDRTGWTEGLDVPVLEPEQEVDVLLYMGCAMAYDDRSKKAARAFVELLKSTDVDFAILGDAEACCGETARRMGHEYLFQVSVEQNIEVFNEYNFKRIVTPCPHCFNTLKNEYPALGGEYEVQHYTELLAEVGVAPVNGAGSGTVTYHDPCYLGRYNQVYDPPRDVLAKTGKTQVEMAQSKAGSFCCGGGGGQTWMETDADTRINNNRLEQALETNAETIATACPYCLLMLDDSIRSQGKGDQIQVMDIAELLAEQLPETT